MFVGSQDLADTCSCVIHLLRICGIRSEGVGEVVVSHLVGGEEVDVSVGDIETSDDITASGSVEGFPDRITDELGRLVHIDPDLLGEVGPAIHLLHGNHQRMAICERFDGEEGNHTL